MKEGKLIKHHIDAIKQKFFILSFQNGEYIVTILDKKKSIIKQHFFQHDEKKASQYFEKIIGGNNGKMDMQ